MLMFDGRRRVEAEICASTSADHKWKPKRDLMCEGGEERER